LLSHYPQTGHLLIRELRMIRSPY